MTPAKYFDTENKLIRQPAAEKNGPDSQQL